MREIGRIQGEAAAQVFSDYLLSIGIASKLMPRDGTVAVWVLDENRLPLATEELSRFMAEPTDPRYRDARKAADSIRAESARTQKVYEKSVRSVSDRWSGPYWRRCPVSFAIMAIAVGVGVATYFGEDQKGIFRYLTFSVWMVNLGTGEVFDAGLSLMRHGQIWRLVTPIFIHFGIPHLVFNLILMRSLGSRIEMNRGSVKLLILILVLAVVSNFGQYFENSFQKEVGQFGGLSGVIYGLFGFAWVRGQTRPDAGLGVPQQLVFMMIAWFFICLTGVVGPVANSAHGAGLVAGMLIALTPL